MKSLTIIAFLRRGTVTLHILASLTCSRLSWRYDHTSSQPAAQTGAVAVLKGAIYPQKNTNAVVHRSPAIEETSEKRLLLRIDTNDFLGSILDETN